MAVLNIKESFITENKSIYDFLNQSERGLYIPLYQRQYSWSKDNIEQLLEDISRGIQRIASSDKIDETKEIRFLGTLITVVEPDGTQIDPVDKEAIPQRIEKVIDGQQRVSTVALMATLLVKRLSEIRKKVSDKMTIYKSVEEICDTWYEKLLTIFAFDLRRGTPRWKPKIIRGQSDYWTRDDDEDTAYTSELSNYLAHFIKAHLTNGTYPALSVRQHRFYDTSVYKNGRIIESWLKKEVAEAHLEQDDEFVPAWKIFSNLSQSSIWEYERQSLIEIIMQKDFSSKKTESYILCELVQTLSVCHYLLDRCCFTIIQPTNEEWAFDMFQSLNATGTPLTAIETFRPLVVNTVEKTFKHKFKDSDSDIYFRKVEDFLSDNGKADAQTKNRRTNDYLTSFFIAYKGTTISTHFSLQRRELIDAYRALTDYNKKLTYIKRMGNYAEFYQNWLRYDGKNGSIFPCIDMSADADLASMLILFLKATNHKMAITMLATMYNNVIEKEPSSEDSFVSIVKAIAAYYFLWRSTSSNSGLDTTYREFFKQHKSFTIDDVTRYMKSILDKKGIGTQKDWKVKAKNYLKYDSTGKEVIRFALLVTAHDTISDEANKGLVKIGRDGCSKYLCVEKWISNDLKTIEHIAPQVNKNSIWDESLYDTTIEPYQSLGNLTLLPQDLNSSAGNKGWKEKFLYYQSVAETDPDKIACLEERATELGVTFNPETIKLLKECHFNQHLSFISSLTAEDSWNRELVNKRTDRMLDIIWNRISKWIF